MTRRFLIACVLAVLTGMALCHVAFAQDADEATVLILAQSIVAEGGWDDQDEHEDHAAILHALRKLSEARHMSIRDHALDFVAAFDSRNNRPRAAWIRALNLQATKPEGWPSDVSWSAHVDYWLRAIETVRAFLRGEVRDPCPQALYWGGPMDDPPAGLVRASCSRVRVGRSLLNTMYAVAKKTRGAR